MTLRHWRDARELALVAAAVCFAATARAQSPGAEGGRLTKFFQSEEPLAVMLTVNVKRIKSDKDTNPPWRAASLSYGEPGGENVTVPLRVRTRGIWRLKNCEFPPLRLNFSNSTSKGSVFHGLNKPKLVDYCRDDDTYERYLLQEFQLYRIYRILTPASHAVRLLHITYADSATGKATAARYAFLEEDPDDLALRMNGRMLKIKGAGPDDLDPYQDALVGVFQYMIGNTDFALGALHNAELLGRNDGENYPVVYDFDFSGAVNARYATVDPRLRVHVVRDRLYRGYCVSQDVYPRVFAQFNAKKDAIYALYRDSIGTLLPPGTVKETLEYFDEFYKTINDTRRAKGEIMDQCLGGKR